MALPTKRAHWQHACRALQCGTVDPSKSTSRCSWTASMTLMRSSTRAVLGGGNEMPPSRIVNHLVRAHRHGRGRVGHRVILLSTLRTLGVKDSAERKACGGPSWTYFSQRFQGFISRFTHSSRMLCAGHSHHEPAGLTPERSPIEGQAG